MEQNKEHEGLINTAILKEAEKLGVTLKDKQYKSITHFCRGKDVLFCAFQVTGICYDLLSTKTS